MSNVLVAYLPLAHVKTCKVIFGAEDWRKVISAGGRRFLIRFFFDIM